MKKLFIFVLIVKTNLYYPSGAFQFVTILLQEIITNCNTFITKRILWIFIFWVCVNYRMLINGLPKF